MSLLLTLAMFVALTSTAFATELTEVNKENLLEAQIQNEIQQMEEIVWADLYNQLKAQNALDGMEYFKSALRPEIEQTIYNKYNVQCQIASANAVTYRYTFPDGGMVCYDGDLNSKNVALWMIPDQTYRFWYEETKTSPLAMVMKVLGYIPSGGLITLMDFQDFSLKYLAQRAIEEAGMYAKVLFISWGSGAEGAVYGYGWNSYPTAEVYNAVRITDVAYGAPV